MYYFPGLLCNSFSDRGVNESVKHQISIYKFLNNSTTIKMAMIYLFIYFLVVFFLQFTEIYRCDLHGS